MRSTHGILGKASSDLCNIKNTLVNVSSTAEHPKCKITPGDVKVDLHLMLMNITEAI